MNNPRFQAVIFDLDGTLLDTLKDLNAAVNHAITEAGYPAISQAQTRAYVGNGLEMLIRRAIPGATDSEVAGCLASLKAYYATHNNVYTRPYPGILSMLKKIKEAGIPMGIVSNKNDPNVQDLSRIHFPGMIDTASGEIAGIRRKPAPDMVLLCLKRLGISPENALYVGDSEVDVQTAANSCMTLAAVLWGFRSREQLLAAGADRLFENPVDLCSFILNREA